MTLKLIQRMFGMVVMLAAATMPVWGATWFALGPYGGDARSFAVDPQNSSHVFLGTATGWVLDSMDGGKLWKRLSRVANRDDLVLDHILVDPRDPKHLTVGGWVIDRPDGGIFESHDGGMTWYAQAQMKGQSIRALTAAPSNPEMLVAGTLQGVYRSMDRGAHWVLISPQGSTEIHEIESVAIDPIDPRIIFAGTWHLPWKTTDGGTTWANITEKDGIHDDSDIFSIIIDPRTPQTVYISACSGIYKSVNGGSRFERTRKEQLGMDHMSLRTRKLTQDPSKSEIVFAGTTEGLWRTLDAGSKWMRMTAPNVVVNDVFVDPSNSNHVLMATDRGGVLVSDDGGVNFQLSNEGFTARQVTSFVSDPRHPSTVYVGVVNDKTLGGVFMSLDGGVHWQQQSLGLNGADIFSLTALNDGTILAGTQHGIYRLENGAWSNSGGLPAMTVPAPLVDKAKPAPTAPKSGKLSSSAFTEAAQGKSDPAQAHRTGNAPLRLATPARVTPPRPPNLDAVIHSMATVGEVVYAGTSNGLYLGTNNGHLWTQITTLQMPETRMVMAQKSIVLVANLRRIALSLDSATTWDSVSMPAQLTQLSTVAVDELGNLWAGGPEGVFYSTDYGLNWKTLRNLYMTRVSGIYFDPVDHRVLVTALNSTTIFAAHLPDYKVNYWDSGWNLRFVRPVGDHLVGVTMYDGVVVQPLMVESKMQGAN